MKDSSCIKASLNCNDAEGNRLLLVLGWQGWGGEY